MTRKTTKAILTFTSDLQTNLAAGWIAAGVTAIVAKDWGGLLLSFVSATVSSYISIEIRKKL